MSKRNLFLIGVEPVLTVSQKARFSVWRMRSTRYVDAMVNKNVALYMTNHYVKFRYSVLNSRKLVKDVELGSVKLRSFRKKIKKWKKRRKSKIEKICFGGIRSKELYRKFQFKILKTGEKFDRGVCLLAERRVNTSFSLCNRFHSGYKKVCWCSGWTNPWPNHSP